MDPSFARAWAKLAVALAVEPQYAQADWETNWNAAEQAIQRATTLDLQDAEAYAALGYVEFSLRHYVAMVAPAERALALDPRDITANFWAANQLAAMGRTADTEALIDRALTLDPANGLLVFYKAAALFRAGDATALKLAHRAMTLGYLVAGMTLAYSRRFLARSISRPVASTADAPGRGRKLVGTRGIFANTYNKN